MKNVDSKSHVRGESVYLDDIPLLEDTLFACVFDSPIAHGKLEDVDIGEASRSEGVKRVILAADLVGENQMANFMVLSSQASGYDLTNFFREWGFKLPQEDFDALDALKQPEPEIDLTSLRE